MDPRTNPYRNDLAAEELRGKVEAATFVKGQPKAVKCGIAPLRHSPDEKAEQTSQIRHGDGFVLYESRNGWAWGQCTRDAYVGYTRLENLVDLLPPETHRINTLSSFVFEAPSVKATILDRLTLFTGVAVKAEQAGEAKTGGGGQRFYELAAGGFVHKEHLTAAANWRAPDPVETALRLLHVPYMWGGITPLGLDCSGLIQLCMEATGRTCPRDSDMQAASLGEKIADRLEGVELRRGDLIYMAGHAGMMADSASLVHANAYHGKVFQEPLKEVAARYDGFFIIRRLAD